MENIFAIYKSVLSGSQRPWLQQNSDIEKFRHLLNSDLRKSADDSPRFFRNCETAFKKLNLDIENDVLIEFKQFSQVPIFRHFVFDSTAYYDKKTEFYQYLIKNTLQSAYSYITSNIPTINIPINVYEIFLVFNKLESLMFSSFKINDLQKENQFVINYLKLCFYILHSALKQHYFQIINFEILTQNELKYRLINSIDGSVNEELQRLMEKFDLPKVENEHLATDTPEPYGSVVAAPSLHSFRYKHFDTKSDNLSDLLDSLKKNGFVAQDTGLRSFKKIFSGESIDKPVVWIGTIADLSYFIKTIHNTQKIVEDLKQKHWEITLKCFVDHEMQPFDREKLRTAKKPVSSFEKIENAAKLLI